MPLRPVQDTWPEKDGTVSAERPETNSEVLRNVDTKDNSRSEHVQNRQNDSELGGN